MTARRIDLTEVVGREASALVADALAEARELARADLVGVLRQAIVDRAIDELTRRKEPEPAIDTADTADRGLYVYAITRTPAVDFTGVTAIDPERPPDLLRHNGITLVVSDVDVSVLRSLPTDDLSETSMLATLVRRHDDVVRAVFAQAPVLPLRFGTVVTDRTAATELLAHHHREATELLDRVAGRREWGVRLRIEESGEQPEAEEPDEPAASGTEYLARRRTALTARENRDRARRAALDSAHTALDRLADDSTTRTAQGRSVLLDAAYLVGTGQEDTFFAEVDRQRQAVREQGIGLDVTGPWPPYSFVGTGLLEATAGA